MKSTLFSNYKVKKLTAKAIESGTRPLNFHELKMIRPEHRYHVYYSKADFKKLLKNYHPMILFLYRHIMIEALNKKFVGNFYVFDGEQSRDLAVICAKYNSYKCYQGSIRHRMIVEHFERPINFEVKDEFTEILIKILHEYTTTFCYEKNLKDFVTQLSMYNADLNKYAETKERLGL